MFLMILSIAAAPLFTLCLFKATLPKKSSLLLLVSSERHEQTPFSVFPHLQLCWFVAQLCWGHG